MPLSPFRARMALVLFLAIASGVGANLLIFQHPAATPAQNRARSGVTSDADRLSKLVSQAFGGDDEEKAVVSARPSEATRPTASSGSTGPATRSVGRFAPSSGALSTTAVPGGDPAESRRATIRAIQAELGRRGYEPGTPDGTPGLVTRAAVLAYEHDQGLPLTADPSPEILAHLRHGTSAPGAAIGLDGEPTPPAGHAEAVIRSVQQSLRTLGYLAGTGDGQVSDDTVRAIREFEMDAGLVPTGRISAPLLARLMRQVASRQRSS